MDATNKEITENEKFRRRPCVIGVDPGLSGAMAVIGIDESIYGVIDLPTIKKVKGRKTKRFFDCAAFTVAIRQVIANHLVIGVVVERVGASPQMGATSAFSFGRTYGSILGVLAAHELPVEDIEPTVWKRKMGVSGSDKKKSVLKAREVFTDNDNDAHLMFPTAKDGRAEAALLALCVVKDADGDPLA